MINSQGVLSFNHSFGSMKPHSLVIVRCDSSLSFLFVFLVLSSCKKKPYHHLIVFHAQSYIVHLTGHETPKHTFRFFKKWSPLFFFFFCVYTQIIRISVRFRGCSRNNTIWHDHLSSLMGWRAWTLLVESMRNCVTLHSVLVCLYIYINAYIHKFMYVFIYTHLSWRGCEEWQVAAMRSLD